MSPVVVALVMVGLALHVCSVYVWYQVGLKRGAERRLQPPPPYPRIACARCGGTLNLQGTCTTCGQRFARPNAP